MLEVSSELRMLLKRDGTHKDCIIHFPNGERDDILNDKIVYGSFRFTESLCSSSEFKFGLCEANAFEVEVVGILKGADEQADKIISSLNNLNIYKYIYKYNKYGISFFCSISHSRRKFKK